MGSTDTDVSGDSHDPTWTQRVFGLNGPGRRRPWPQRAGVAIGLSLLAGHVTSLLGSLGERTIFMLPFLAVATAGLYGGFGGAMVATLCSVLFAAFALLPPAGTFAVPVGADQFRLAALLLAGSAIAILCELLHRAFRQVLERESALRESEESYRALFHTLTEMVYIQDLDGRFLDVNRAVERTYGYSREELLGQTPALLADPERTDMERTMMLVQLAAGGLPQCMEWWGRRRDGSTFPKEVTLTRGYYFGRQVLIAVARDITTRKEVEIALAASEEQLRQAQKMEAIGRLAGGVAHDFNNLLTAIRGNAELAALELPSGSPAHAELVEISTTADRAASLTRQLLAFSRKQVRQPRLLDLNVVLAEMERMLVRVIGDDVELITRGAATPACVFADVGQMEQVILNLVVNARDALPRGGQVRVEIGAGELSSGAHIQATQAVVLTVRDTGSGIPADVIEHIFEPFFTTKAQGKGTGLGLSTVYGIVRQNGGDITVESEPGEGTCFRVLLPLAEGRPVVAPCSGSPAPGAAGKGTILLVEDDTDVRSLTERILRRGGYQVVAAGGGQDALAIVRERSFRPDLLLTDVLMPEMNGAELAEQLLRELPDLPVLFVSGYAPDTIPFAGVASPGAMLLEKPFTAESLLRHVAARIAARAA